MDFSSILEKLKSRDDIIKNQSFWDDAVHMSSAVFQEIQLQNSLKKDVPRLQEEVKKIESDLEANTESGKLKNDIKKMNNEITTQNDLIESAKSNLSLIDIEVHNLRKEKHKIKDKLTEIRGRHTTLANQIQQLETEIAQKGEQAQLLNQEKDELLKKTTAKENERDRITEKLLKLKNIEVEYRNVEYHNLNPKSKEKEAPKAELEKSRAPLPVADHKDDSSDDILNDDFESKESQMFIGDLKLGTRFKEHRSTVTALAFANVQPFFASGSQDSSVSVVRTDDNSKVKRLTESSKTIMSINFSPCDTMLLTTSYDGGVRLYHTSNFEMKMNIGADKGTCVTDAAFITEAKFVTTGRNQSIRLFDVSRGEPTKTIIATSTANSVIPWQGESLVVTGHFDGYLRGYDIRSSEVAFELKTHKLQIIQAIGNQSNLKVLTISEDRTMAYIDMRERAIIGSINFQQAGLPSEKIQMAAAYGDVIIGSTTGEIYEYDLSTFKLRGTTKVSNEPVCCVAASTGRGLLACGDKDGAVKFWHQ